jgi:spermidine/putrescine transport system substrate-binding protein
MSHPRPSPHHLPAEVRELLAQSSLSRRGFVRGAGLAGVAVGLPTLLSACGTQAAKQSADSCVSKDASSSEKTLHFSNWPLYLDEKKVKKGGKKVTVFPTLAGFEKQSGITVDYVTDINDNSAFFGVVRNQLAACKATGRDIMTLTDWMAARMVDLGWLQKLDHAHLPNVKANLVSTLRSPVWDKKRDFSVPWQSGLTGIAYNSKLTKPVGSFQELLTRPDLKGKVTLLSEMHDTMLFMLLLEGADPEKFTADQFGSAIDRLKKATDAGQVRSFTGNEYAQDLAKGNIVACEAWSGDVIQLQFDNPDIKFVAPEEGLSLWSDNMLVPNKAGHKANAEKLMNYYYEPEVAASLAAWVNYICPVEGAKQAMEKVDSSLVDNKLIFPDAGTLAKAKGFMTLDQKTERDYQKQFASVTGA